MRPAPTPEQDELKAAARELLGREVDPDRLQHWEADPLGCDPGLASAVAGLGWIGLGLPASCGGSAAPLVDVCCLLEECARGLLPRPLVGAIRAANALALVDPAHPLLPSIARGERRVAVAIDEPNRRSHPPFATRIADVPGGRVLDGLKVYVPDADGADLHLVACEADDVPAFAVVERAAAGVSVEPLRGFGGDRQAHVHYRATPVGREVPGASGAARPLEALRLQQLAFALAEMVGGMSAVLDMTVEYVKMREQFGQKIAVFQAVRHQVADMGTTFTAARHLAWQAITRIAGGRPSTNDVASASAYVGQAFKRICWTAHHLHGGAGFVVEHRLRFHSERAQSLCIRYTPEGPALAAVAAVLLDGAA